MTAVVLIYCPLSVWSVEYEFDKWPNFTYGTFNNLLVSKKWRWRKHKEVLTETDGESKQRLKSWNTEHTRVYNLNPQDWMCDTLMFISIHVCTLTSLVCDVKHFYITSISYFLLSHHAFVFVILFKMILKLNIYCYGDRAEKKMAGCPR